jgi:hypothetical protein
LLRSNAYPAIKIEGECLRRSAILYERADGPKQSLTCSQNRKDAQRTAIAALLAFEVGQAHVPVMRAYLFASELDPAVSAFSEDAEGANLPAAYAPWRALNGGASLLVGPSSVLILEAIKRQGFYLLTDKPDRSG